MGGQVDVIRAQNGSSLDQTFAMTIGPSTQTVLVQMQQDRLRMIVKHHAITAVSTNCTMSRSIMSYIELLHI